MGAIGAKDIGGIAVLTLGAPPANKMRSCCATGRKLMCGVNSGYGIRKGHFALKKKLLKKEGIMEILSKIIKTRSKYPTGFCKKNAENDNANGNPHT